MNKIKTSYTPARLTFLIATIVVLFLVGYSSFSTFRSRADSTKTGPQFVNILRPLQLEEQIGNIPYFVESEELQSTLTLNNGQTGVNTVSVTIFSSNGTALAPQPIILQPLTVTRIKLRELLKDAPASFHTGNIQLSHFGAPMDVTSQVTISSPDTRISFESYELGMKNFATTRLDGIVWTPDPKSEAAVALTNAQSSSILSVTIRSEQEEKQLSLGPRETRLVDLQDFLKKSNKGGARATLMSLEHNGVPGSLIPTAFVLNKKSGFSSNLSFVDCGTVKSMTLAAAHVRFGRSKRDDGFPSGTVFRAPLLLANTMDKPTGARISVDYTIAGAAKRVELNPIVLAAREVKEIELSTEMIRKGVTGPVDEAGVDINYDGMPGTVIARLTSYDTKGDYSFDVPVKDPRAGINRGNGRYPWRLDNGYTTVVHLKNTMDKEVEAAVQIRYEGGSYNPELIKLKPYQTIAIDIRALRDAQQKDVRESVMPEEVESGQVAWYESEDGSLIGRAEVRNTEDGIASSFSCPGNCQCGMTYRSGSMNPTGSTAAVGAVGFMYQPREMRQDCNFIQWGPYVMNANEWFTSNSSQITVTNSGVETCVAPGNPSVTAKWQSVMAYNMFMCGCCPIYGFGNASANCDIGPQVNMTNITGVGKGFTNTVQVSLNPSPSANAITLSLSTTSGSGSAVFDANGQSTMTVSTSGPVLVRGVTESSTAGNIKLEAKRNTLSLGSFNFTVVQVTLSLRTSGSISSDNSARAAYISAIGSDILQTRFSTGSTFQMWRTNVEIVATVLPANFSSPIVLTRDAIGFCKFNDTLPLGCSNNPDPSAPQFRDDDPQSGGSGGKVYDSDAPGHTLGLDPNAPLDSIARIRTNFRQWATIDGAKCSDDLMWFSRLSIKKTLIGENLETSVSGDNVAGSGTTNLTWNLQP